MRTIIAIPARLKASRLPNKPLLLLGGVPMVIRVARQAAKCLAADVVLIATDSKEIMSVAHAYNVKAVCTHAKHQSGTDRVAEATADMQADIIVNVQSDEPFIDPVDLSSLIRYLQSTNAEMATLARPIATEQEFMDPNVVKVTTNTNGIAHYFSRAPIPYAFDHENFGSAHVGIYAYRPQALQTLATTPPTELETREKLEQLRALDLGFRIGVITASGDAKGIDTQTDWEWAQQRVAQRGERAFPGIAKIGEMNES